ncbi:Mu transposase C-terminal domain-containing protein [Pseudacidovorax sp. RU35E]|uniref:Mu transposase C-terminal domain-containing protein n=1 Tax=Pseudacidovorax sp. RU35E TaxID=1907403 RepID=UPI000970C245|nr:Mu transposase C-terminal domain-containing protein [Pseudacidovorax sp. RU35E]
MTWRTARELAGLPGMPSSERRTRERLARLGLPSRQRAGREGGGGMEYDCSALPAETRKAILVNQIAAVPVLPTAALATPIAKPIQSAALPAVATAARRPPSDQERACADARLILIQHAIDLAGLQGRDKACQMLALQLLTGQASAELQMAARLANRRARTAAVSARTLYRWLSQYQTDGWSGLLPAEQTREVVAALDEDVAEVLARYHSRNALYRNLSVAAKEVTKDLGRTYDSWEQLYGRARRALAKVDKVKLIKARHSGSERAAKLPYKKRDTSMLRPLDVCLVDGHTFKAKVRHPDHGAPFAPEVTLVIDAATRRVCGWSASLSENTIAVGDAMRHAVGNAGVWAIVYSDNGAGERAKVFDCPVDGIMKRLGSDHRTGIAGHPQGHGLIERSWRTHMINVARRFGSYQGSDVDQGTLRKVRADIDKERRALKRAESSGGVVALTPKVPSWQQFLDAVEAGVAEYNACHRHRSLPRRADNKRMTPDEAWEAMFEPELQVKLDVQQLRMTFMPSVLRTATRGLVTLFNQDYTADELMGMAVDGKQVSVRYDIHDPSFVLIYTTAGEFVCQAKWDGRKGDYFPKAVIDHAREQRARRAVRRLEDKVELALREISGPPLAETLLLPEPSAPEVLVPIVVGTSFAEPLPTSHDEVEEVRATLRRPFFESESDRYEWLMGHRGEWSGEDTQWVRGYVAGAEYAGLREYFQSRGLAWDDDEAIFKSAR